MRSGAEQLSRCDVESEMQYGCLLTAYSASILNCVQSLATEWCVVYFVIRGSQRWERGFTINARTVFQTNDCYIAPLPHPTGDTAVDGVPNCLARESKR
jgi:hypothetical protein